MTLKKNFKKFSFKNIKIDKAFAEKSIIATFNTIWWEFFTAYLTKKGLDVRNLKTIEVGCGSGAKSLILAMMEKIGTATIY